jgi:hypothetical protein
MTDQTPEPTNPPAATTKTPVPAPGWDDPWSRPSAWAAFGSDTNPPKDHS